MRSAQFTIAAFIVATLPFAANGSDCASLRPGFSAVYLRPYYFPPGLLPGDEVDIYLREDANPEGRLILSTHVFAVAASRERICLELPDALARTLPQTCEHLDVVVFPPPCSSWRFPRPSVSSSNSPTFSHWLGPQQNYKDNGTFVPALGLPIDPDSDRRLSKYKFGLQVLPASEMALPRTSNPLVMFNGTKFTQATEFTPDPNNLYLLATIHLTASRGWRIYTLNARVTSGPLKGAIVHFRNGKVQESIAEPCVAVYKIPKDIDVPPGAVAFEVVSFFAK